MAERIITNPGTRLRASVQVPGDKSLSHRALLFAAIAEGDSYISGLGPGDDVHSTIEALDKFGVIVDGEKIRSPGIAHWRVPTEPIDCGNSATAMRLLAGVLSTSPVKATLVGDSSLSARPMHRLVEPLTELGGNIDTSPEGTPPLKVGGATGAQGNSVTIDVASAQVRSAFELAALNASGPSMIDSHLASGITRSGGSLQQAEGSGHLPLLSPCSRGRSFLLGTKFRAIRPLQHIFGRWPRSNPVGRC